MKFLTTVEIRELLGVHRNTVGSMLQRGEFPNAIRIQNQWRIPESDFEAYLERARNRAKAARRPSSGRASRAAPARQG